MLGLIKRWQIGKPCDKLFAEKIFCLLPPLKPKSTNKHISTSLSSIFQNWNDKSLLNYFR